MNTAVDFIERSRENALLIPVEAVLKEKDGNYVLIKQDNGKEPLKVRVTLGISDDKNVEVISGIGEKDSIILKAKRYSLPKKSVGSNPFLPGRRR